MIPLQEDGYVCLCGDLQAHTILEDPWFLLQADEENRRRASPMPVQNFLTPASATDFHSTSSSPMVLGKKRVPGVVARLMGLESLPNAAAGRIMSHLDPRSSCAAELMDIDSAAADNRSSVITSSRFEENVPLEYEQSELPAMLLQELLLCNLDDETDDTGRSCSKLVGLVADEGVKLEMVMDLKLHRTLCKKRA
jgi:hypothetical protein